MFRTDRSFSRNPTGPNYLTDVLCLEVDLGLKDFFGGGGILLASHAPDRLTDVVQREERRLGVGSLFRHLEHHPDDGHGRPISQTFFLRLCNERRWSIELKIPGYIAGLRLLDCSGKIKFVI
jgi:hypothetical protein